jgi:hypothetical protein
MDMMDPAKLEAKMAASRKTDFSNWLSQPTTRFMMSMIPAGEKQEALQTLLQAAYDGGFNSGSSLVAVSFLTEMIKHRP